MVVLGKIHVGDLGTIIDILFQDTSYQDINSPLDLTLATSIQITFIDPDGVIIGPFTMTRISPPGTDGLAYYTTDLVTSLWTKGGFWNWFGTATFPSKKVSTVNAIREVLS